jgi:pimeloyl-ACP methyl ester carboxylesterase
VLAVEPRFKTSILVAGGLNKRNTTAEAQPLNFVSHVTLPVLLVTGRNDFMFPYETVQRPLFESLGPPPEDKRHVVLDSGHAPMPWNEAIREILKWTDRWLGPVSQSPVP